MQIYLYSCIHINIFIILNILKLNLILTNFFHEDIFILNLAYLMVKLKSKLGFGSFDK